MRQSIAGLFALIFTLTASVPALARTCEGVNLPNSVTVDGTELVLNGMGIREATAFQVNVYVAGLYLEQRSNDAAAILASDTRKRITLRFVHEVERDDVVEAMRDGFRNNAPGTPAAKINQLIGWTSAMAVGNTMQFTYVPGRGTEFSVNGQVKGTIEGADFARSVFSLYIGRNPPNRGLRVGLLGGRCG